LTYKNFTYGIVIQYPSDWITDERDYHSDRNRSKVVGFLSPSETNPGEFEDRLLIEVHELRPSMDLDDYSHNRIDNIRSKISKPSSFTLIDSSPCVLAGNIGKKIVYRTKSPNEDQIKTIEVLTIKDDKSYIIIYAAASLKYDSYLPIIEKMIETLEISNPSAK
jgi:eukaryotic-like serine/threonine-protein kinase